ncbi:hypothetical protein [Palleronia sp.]|uniref:hypothetical protein n=1 Tax=Palleronia sp. TaxID=1940284 RepID=UPI0035C7D480
MRRRQVFRGLEQSGRLAAPHGDVRVLLPARCLGDVPDHANSGDLDAIHASIAQVGLALLRISCGSMAEPSWPRGRWSSASGQRVMQTRLSLIVVAMLTIMAGAVLASIPLVTLRLTLQRFGMGVEEIGIKNDGATSNASSGADSCMAA